MQAEVAASLLRIMDMLFEHCCKVKRRFRTSTASLQTVYVLTERRCCKLLRPLGRMTLFQLGAEDSLYLSTCHTCERDDRGWADTCI